MRWWSCAPGGEQQPAGCMMGLKAVSQQDEGMEVRKVPLLGLGFLRAAQYPADLVGFGHPVLKPRRGSGGPTRADRVRSQSGATRGGRTSTGGSAVTRTSVHSHPVKVHNSSSVVTPYM